MAKNYAAVYNNENDSSSLEQSFYLKLEATRGTLTAPVGADFFFTLAGGSISFSQPQESSPIKTGRHHSTTILKKKEMTWTIPSYFMINTALGAPAAAEIDPAKRLLYKSLFGYEDATAGAVYDSREDPSVTFSIFECGDLWAHQARGCFVNNATFNFPGDGEATEEWSGAGAEAFLVGIGQSVANNNGGNTVTLAVGEGDKFPVGCMVMIIEADGLTRSADTPTGSPRFVTAVVGDVVTVSGAPLADADGSGVGLPVYLSYYEPTGKVAINNPITGLVGSVTIVGLADTCLRNASITVANDHELVNYCFGEDALHGSYFVAANRVTTTASIEMNLNHEVLKFFNNIQQFVPQDMTLILGNALSRHLEVTMPKIQFTVPEFAVPETGSIPITFEGTGYQTAVDAADELTFSFI